MRLSPVLDRPAHLPVPARSPRPSARSPRAASPLIDFGIGEPREETPAFIREALAASIDAALDLPRGRGAAGAARRRSRAGCARRFGVALDPDARGRAHARLQGGDLPPRPGARRRPGRGARRRATRSPSAAPRFAGKEVLELPLRAEGGFLPDLDAVAAGALGPRGDPVAQLPQQPDRRDRPARSSTSAPRRSRGGTASCWPPTRPTPSSTSATTRPRSALQVADRTNVAVFNTLSKRSSMPGYRSGFVAGDPELIAALKRYRPNVGVGAAGVRPARRDRRVGRRGPRRGGARALPRQARRAAAGARGGRAAPRRRRRDVLPVAGAGPTPTRSPPGCSSAASCSRPGSVFGPAGAGYVRLALVPTLEECERAAATLADALTRWRAAPR